jgi:hypothetical protein
MAIGVVKIVHLPVDPKEPSSPLISAFKGVDNGWVTL